MGNAAQYCSSSADSIHRVSFTDSFPIIHPKISYAWAAWRDAINRSDIELAFESGQAKDIAQVYSFISEEDAVPLPTPFPGVVPTRADLPKISQSEIAKKRGGKCQRKVRIYFSFLLSSRFVEGPGASCGTEDSSILPSHRGTTAHRSQPRRRYDTTIAFKF